MIPDLGTPATWGQIHERGRRAILPENPRAEQCAEVAVRVARMRAWKREQPEPPPAPWSAPTGAWAGPLGMEAQ